MRFISLLIRQKSSSQVILQGYVVHTIGLTDQGGMVLAMLMAIQSAQLEDISLPVGAISICGHIDSSFSFGMDIERTRWDSTVNPHGTILAFKPSPAIPKLNLADAHPFLPSMDVAMHPLASPILCHDEMFKSLPPLLMLMSDGALFYPEFSRPLF
jgi:hypothetical protein